MERCIRECANSHKLSFDSLQYHVRRRLKVVEAEPIEHGNRKLTDLQEFAIVGVIQALSECGAPLRQCQAVDLVKRCWGVELTPNWFTRFAKRHAALLKFKKARVVKPSRTQERRFVDVEQFCEIFDRITNEMPLAANNVINADETRVATPRDFVDFMKIITSVSGIVGASLRLSTTRKYPSFRSSRRQASASSSTFWFRTGFRWPATMSWRTCTLTKVTVLFMRRAAPSPFKFGSWRARPVS